MPRLLQQDISHQTYINLSKNKCFSCSEKDKRFLTEDSKGKIVPSEEFLANCFQFSKYRSSTLFCYCKRSAIFYGIKDKIFVAVLNIATVRVIWYILKDDIQPRAGLFQIPSNELSKK